jgi:hypothetical protein
MKSNHYSKILKKNSRLRNFAHIVSHNLRSHSIGISGILDLIKLETELYNNELVGLVNKSVENLKQTVGIGQKW